MNTHMNQADIDLLDTIQRVEASPYLLTRIQQRIESKQATRFSTTWSWAIGISFVVLLLLNIATIRNNHGSSTHENNLAQSMNLLPNHNLYNE